MLPRKYVYAAIFAIVLVLFSALAALANQPAQAEDPQHWINVAGIACETGPEVGYVDFQVWSWVAESPRGDNQDILVQYQVETNDNKVSGYVDYMHGSFSSDNRYRFGSMIPTTGDIKRVTLIVTALGEWGDGKGPGQMTYLELFPADCDGPTSDPVEGEPVYRVLLPNIQRSFVPWLLLVAPVLLFGAGSNGAQVFQNGNGRKGDEVILHLTGEEVTALATAITVARTLYEQDTSRIEEWLQPCNPEQVAGEVGEVQAGIVEQVAEWRRLELRIAQQRVLDAKMKLAFSQKPL